MNHALWKQPNKSSHVRLKPTSIVCAPENIARIHFHPPRLLFFPRLCSLSASLHQTLPAALLHCPVMSSSWCNGCKKPGHVFIRVNAEGEHTHVHVCLIETTICWMLRNLEHLFDNPKGYKCGQRFLLAPFSLAIQITSKTTTFRAQLTRKFNASCWMRMPPFGGRWTESRHGRTLGDGYKCNRSGTASRLPAKLAHTNPFYAYRSGCIATNTGERIQRLPPACMQFRCATIFVWSRKAQHSWKNKRVSRYGRRRRMHWMKNTRRAKPGKRLSI